MTRSDSSRSSIVSPIPSRMPVVNGIESFPAFSIISILTAGSFPGVAVRRDVGGRLEHQPHAERNRP